MKDTPTGRAAGFAGLFHCGNPWVCMTCAAVIAAERASELTRVLAHFVALGGWACLITMTIRHNRDQSLDELLDALSAGWSKGAISGAGWIRDRPEGYAGWCRVVEVTDGPNGWHPHVHAVVVFHKRPPRAVIEAMAEGMFDRFSRAVQRQGLAAPDRDNHGLDVRHLDDGMAEGQSPGQLAEVWARYVAKGLAAEATLGAAKVAKGSNRSIRELMRDALLPQRWESPGTGVVETLDLRARDRLVEYEAATHGRRVMTWSQRDFDLRKQVGLAPERTDEEIADDSDLEGEDVAVITREGWAVLDRMRGQAELLDVMERAGAEAGRSWLTGHGIEWYQPTGLTDQRRHGLAPGRRDE